MISNPEPSSFQTRYPQSHGPSHTLNNDRVNIHGVKARSHREDAWGTHGQRIGNLQFGPVRCRSLGVRHHSLLVRRARWTNAGPALCMRRHSLCASGFFEHAQKRAPSSTHEYTRQRHARHAPERARPAPDMRGAR